MTVTRRIDDLGRIVLPKEMREAMRLKEGEALDLTSTYEGKIIIEKAQPISPDEPKITIADNRKMCVIRYDYDEPKIILLTEEQFKFLDWLSENDFLDGNVTYGRYDGQKIEVI